MSPESAYFPRMLPRGLAWLSAALLILLALAVAMMAAVVLEIGRSEAYDCTEDYSTAVAAGTVVVVLVGAVVLVTGLATGRARLARGAALAELGALAVWLTVGGVDWFDCAMGV